MKNILFLTSFFVSVYSFTQNNTGEKTLKLEIRTNNSENEVYRKTNEHTSERINIKREDKKDILFTPSLNRHNRPHLDKPSIDKSSKGESKKEHPTDKRREHHHDKLQQRQERKEGRNK